MTHPVQQDNPLRQYFRSFKLYMKLPSGTTYYPPGVVNFNDMGEIGVLPMSGQDEMTLKNPDALLNGEALISVIANCVPAIKDPRQLLTNDTDALITAIRYATFNDTLESNIPCPACGHQNSYKLDLQYALDNMDYLDPDYVVNLDSGATVFIRPYTFPDVVKALHSQFEQSKLAKNLAASEHTDEERSLMFARSFKEIGTIKFDLMANCIKKVVDESKNISVTDRAFIREFLVNIDKNSADKISEVITKINQIGIKRSFTAACEKCKHEWESEIDFNPVNFS